MPFYVSVQYRAWPEQRDALRVLIRRDLSASSASHPGLRFARVFQHLTEPDWFLAFEEWQSQAEYQRLRESPAFLESLAAYGPPPQADALERLQLYRRLPYRPTALTCVSLTTSPEQAQAVEDRVCDDAQRAALVDGGLVIRAVYRVTEQPGRLLVLHGWRSLAQVERYQETLATDTETALRALGAAVDSFVGEITAEFSWLER